MGLYASGNIHCLSESKFYFRVSGLSARWVFLLMILIARQSTTAVKMLILQLSDPSAINLVPRSPVDEAGFGFSFVMYRFGDNLRKTLQRKIASSVLKNFWENHCLRNKVLSRQQLAQIQCDLIKHFFPTRPKSEGPTYSSFLYSTRSLGALCQPKRATFIPQKVNCWKLSRLQHSSAFLLCVRTT